MMADQAPDDEKETQSVTEHHTEEICSKSTQDHENIHNPHVDNEKDIKLCDNKGDA